MEAAEDVYGEGNVVIEPNMSGGGPMYGFDKFLNVPIMGTGVGWSKANVHAPNENIREKDFYEGVAYIMTLLEKLRKTR